MTRRPAIPLLLAGLLLTTACAGPERRLEVGFKEVPSNVVLGSQSSPAAAPDGSSGPVTIVYLPPPSVVALPPPPFEVPDDRPTRPAPSPPAEPVCATADPLEAPVLEAPSRIEAPPAEAAYVFRNDGRFETSGADAQSGTFTAPTLRTVKRVFQSDDGLLFDFSVTETLGSTTTTTTYRVIRETALLAAPDGSVEPGLYLTRVESLEADGQTSTFAPTPHVRLAALPLVRGEVVESRGVDPATAMTMSLTSTVTGKDRVDACGTPLDSWTLDVTGTVLSPEEELEFASTYAIGTQYGGLILRETVAFTGTVGDAGVSRTNTATVSQEPSPAGGPQP